jgi:hypothetical protein
MNRIFVPFPDGREQVSSRRRRFPFLLRLPAGIKKACKSCLITVNSVAACELWLDRKIGCRFWFGIQAGKIVAQFKLEV